MEKKVREREDQVARNLKLTVLTVVKFMVKN